MPIYEYYCPENHTIYQFYAKTLAQGQTVPRCPDNPAFKLRKMVSTFAITRGDTTDEGAPDAVPGEESVEDPRLEAAMSEMEREFSNVDENDPRAMARMMRRMAELTGEPIDGEMEEVVRKLEEGTDPEALEEQMGVGSDESGGMDDPYGDRPADAATEPPSTEKKYRFRLRRTQPRRDPHLYDYE